MYSHPVANSERVSSVLGHAAVVCTMSPVSVRPRRRAVWIIHIGAVSIHPIMLQLRRPAHVPQRRLCTASTDDITGTLCSCTNIGQQLAGLSYIFRESQTTRNVLWSSASVCLSVSLSVRGRMPTHGPDVTWGSVDPEAVAQSFDGWLKGF